MANLYIPKKIKVGYQKREDTYTNKLAYVIYYDERGKLRKEKSWTSWCDEKQGVDEFDNVPTDNFVLNKAIKRYRWSHFGSNRSMIRIYDPRGIEFEITPENLIGILMETDCNKRMLDGKFVYAWWGTDLVVLPCGSEEYKKAIEHTERQYKKVSARELKAGCSYTSKKGEEYIYMGRYDWYVWIEKQYRKAVEKMESRYGYSTAYFRGYRIEEKIIGREKKKAHIFYNVKADAFEKVSNVPGLISYENSSEPVINYPELAERTNDDIRFHEIKGFGYDQISEEEIDKIVSKVTEEDDWAYVYRIFQDEVIKYSIRSVSPYDLNAFKNIFSHYEIKKCDMLNKKTFETNDPGHNNENYKCNTVEDLRKYLRDGSFIVPYYKLSSGGKYNLKSMFSYRFPGDIRKIRIGDDE